MNKEQLQQEINDLTWFHSIPLPYRDIDHPLAEISGYIFTPGMVDHCTPAIANNRFGIPDELDGLGILDVGCWDGFFSFLAEARGAAGIMALDPLKGCSGQVQTHAPFELAKKALASKRVLFNNVDLQTYYRINLTMPQPNKFDIIFYFGVLYHIDSPFLDLVILADLLKTGGFALIETAMSTRRWTRGAMWELKPGFAGDPTNTWYPTERGLVDGLFAAGFSRVERIYISRDRSRATFKAIK